MKLSDEEFEVLEKWTEYMLKGTRFNSNKIMMTGEDIYIPKEIRKVVDSYIENKDLVTNDEINAAIVELISDVNAKGSKEAKDAVCTINWKEITSDSFAWILTNLFNSERRWFWYDSFEVDVESVLFIARDLMELKEFEHLPEEIKRESRILAGIYDRLIEPTLDPETM